MQLLGIDENGYGPALGPLVITVSLMETDQPNNLWHSLGLASSFGAAPFVCDSKEVFGKSGYRTARAEEVILAFFALQEGFIPEDFATFSSRILGNEALGFSFPCFGEENYKPFCFQERISLPLYADLGRIQSLKETLVRQTKEAGITNLKVRSLILCPCLFNRFLEQTGMSKASLVASLGLRLAAYLSEPNADFLLEADKVSGISYYASFLQEAYPDCHLVVEVEQRGSSAYRLYRKKKNCGQAFWRQNGERTSFTVALASLFGKYSRDTFWQMAQSSLNSVLGSSFLPVSGYRDKYTKEYIKKTASLRRDASLPDECFLRCR